MFTSDSSFPFRELSGFSFLPSYEHIAQVIVRGGLFFSDLIIETRGDGTLIAVGLPNRAAREARELIEQRLRGW